MRDETEDKSDPVQVAEDVLYSSLDRNGATNRTTYLISNLIDAKIAEALEEMVNRIEQASGIRP